MIAGDEMRHHHAYSEFVNRIFQVDPSENDDCFSIYDEAKIVMPAHFLRESGQKISTALNSFLILHELVFIRQLTILISCRS
jgi:acyl-[acyl-carrier-protein] desaturase